jgi:peptidoglycan/LPS O-acetylase OafA/YrhL
MQLSSENKSFLIYIGKYLGVALIAGSVVHIGTLQNAFFRYIFLAIIGLFLMMLCSILEAKQNKQEINFRFLSVLVGLSFATGFLSGGVQHYLDNPVYAGYLLSIGFFVAYVTYFWSHNVQPKKKNVLIVFTLSLLFLLFSNFILVDLADDLHFLLEGSSEPHAH